MPARNQHLTILKLQYLEVIQEPPPFSLLQERLIYTLTRYHSIYNHYYSMPIAKGRLEPNQLLQGTRKYGKSVVDDISSKRKKGSRLTEVLR